MGSDAAPVPEPREEEVAVFVPAPGALLHSVALGPDVDPVLALNGWCATWEAWAPTFELLSTTRRCLSYDTRGSGGSPCRPDDITLDHLVDDVFRVLDAHGVGRCVLAGESLGGFVAQLAALRDPGRFHHLVLVSSAPFVTSEAVGRWVNGARTDFPATVGEFVRECLSEPEAAALHPWGVQLFLGADPACAARLFECCFDTVPDLGSLTVPTTVVHGDGDRIVPPVAGEYLAASIPNAAHVVLAGAGHGPTVTRPHEVAAAFPPPDGRGG